VGCSSIGKRGLQSSVKRGQPSLTIGYCGCRTVNVSSLRRDHAKGRVRVGLCRYFAGRRMAVAVAMVPSTGSHDTNKRLLRPKNTREYTNPIIQSFDVSTMYNIYNMYNTHARTHHGMISSHVGIDILVGSEGHTHQDTVHKRLFPFLHGLFLILSRNVLLPQVACAHSVLSTGKTMHVRHGPTPTPSRLRS
jgi:hypothetical protein